jgi:hypothetical protein
MNPCNALEDLYREVLTWTPRRRGQEGPRQQGDDLRGHHDTYTQQQLRVGGRATDGIGTKCLKPLGGLGLKERRW